MGLNIFIVSLFDSLSFFVVVICCKDGISEENQASDSSFGEKFKMMVLKTVSLVQAKSKRFSP